MDNRLFAEASRLEEKGEAFALAFISDVDGSVPRNSGRMLIRIDGSSIGTVGGGLIETLVLREAAEALRTGKPRTVRKQLTPKGEDAIGMECGGAMEIRIDVIGTATRLLLVGGGHVNLAIAKAAATLGFAVEIVENRKELCTHERFPMVRNFWYDKEFVRAIDQSKPDNNTWVVIATHNNDLDALSALAGRNCAYLGMLGSKRKVAAAVDRLSEEGVPASVISKLRTPIGLDIGAHTPEEIAISILAEILKIQRKRSGLPFLEMSKDLVIVRGGGDLATGVAWRLKRCGFKVIVLEIANPTAIRRTVAFASALIGDTITVEGIHAQRVENLTQAYGVLKTDAIPVLVDPEALCLANLKPAVLVDAIMAKKNCGTHLSMAPVVVALGPGFTAGEEGDCHAVIETARGHRLGRVIDKGSAAPDTGIPSMINGKNTERVLRAPKEGVFRGVVQLGELVEEKQVVARIESESGTQDIAAPFAGKVRGLLADGNWVNRGFKVGDIDPRGADVNEHLISDKARAVAGGVLEAVLKLQTEGFI